MRRLRTALIGCGKVGPFHAQALQNLPRSEFVGVCDADPSRAADFAARYGATAYPDAATMLRASGAEVVCVTTPHPTHAAATLACAAAGAHVLVEKPMAASLADCDAMLAATRDAGVRLGVISQRRWYEPVLRMRQAIDSGLIGTPGLGVVMMLSWREPSYYRSDPWRGRWDTEGGGVLVNQAPHQLDLLQWFMGPITEISGAWANLNHPEVEIEDTAVATVRFANGGLGSIVASLSQRPGITTRVHIHGRNGASIGVETDRGATFIAGMTGVVEPALNDLWTIPGAEGALARFEAEDRARFATIDPLAHYHALQIDDFLDAVLNDRAPLVTGEDGRTVVAMFQAIYRSQRERRPIPFPLDA